MRGGSGRVRAELKHGTGPDRTEALMRGTDRLTKAWLRVWYKCDRARTPILRECKQRDRAMMANMASRQVRWRVQHYMAYIKLIIMSPQC